MNTIFDISSKEITQLNPFDFSDLMNKLLWAEGSRIGILPTNIYTTLRINVSDKGIDAKIINNDKQSYWIPLGNTIFQFRTGKMMEAKLKKEIKEHPEVQDFVKAGGNYCFLNNHDYISLKKTELENAMLQCFIDLGIPSPKTNFLTAHQIAKWTSEIPALSFLPYFNHPVYSDFMRWDTLKDLPRFRQSFKADKSRQDIKNNVRNSLISGKLIHLRIEGLAGVGKTRLALECFRPDKADSPNEKVFSDVVMYASSPEYIPAGLFSWMEVHSEAWLVLVVDECDRIEADRFKLHAERCQGRIKLLTIGLAKDAKSTVYPEYTFLLDTLDDKSMEELLKEAYPTLPKEAVSFIEKFSSGYVKLATSLAEAILRNIDIASALYLSKSYEVKQILDRFLVPDPTNRKVLQGMALLTRLGFEGDIENEGREVMKFLNVDWQDALRVTQSYINEGLIIKRGRYRYITPHLLAVYLAAEAWEAFGSGIITELFPKLPNWNSRKSLLQRLKDLGGEPKAKEICEILLNKDFFPDLNSINDKNRAEIFAILTENNPRAGLLALERIIGHLPRDQLLKFRDGRRHTIWVLEKLAWLPETFFGAGRLLLSLAEAENETYGNNATNTWTGLFRTYLGGTSVPAIQRHILIKEALESESEERRKLAVKAIETALLFVGHEMRIGGAEMQGGRLVPPEWRPKTIKEDHEVRLSALSLLDIALSDKNDTVRNEAEKVLRHSLRGLVSIGLTDEVIKRFKRLPIEETKKRREFRETIEEVQKWESKYLSEQQRSELEQLLEKLRGKTFSDRLRRWVSFWTISDHELESKIPGTAEKEIKILVEEIIKNPSILEPELNWLISDDAHYIFLLGRYLGELDKELVFFFKLEELACEGKGIPFLSSYMHGKTLAGQKKWRDEILDKWVNEGKSMSLVVLNVIWRSTPDDTDAERLIRLVKDEHLLPENLGIFLWGGQTKHFSKEVFYELIELILKSDGDNATASAIQLLDQRLDFHPNDKDYLEPLAWQAIKKYKPISRDTMVEHHWECLVRKYLKKDPKKMAEIILSIFHLIDNPLLSNDPLMKILSEVTRLSQREVWAVVSAQLKKKDRTGFRLLISLKGWYALAVGDKILLEWAEKNQPDGPYIVATITSVHGVPLNPLARELLIRYGKSKDVRSALYANFDTGIIAGSMVNWLKSQLEKAREWLKDSHPAVREWAKIEVQSLEKEIAREKQREEEGYF
jgi:hypothetical protein